MTIFYSQRMREIMITSSQKWPQNKLFDMLRDLLYDKYTTQNKADVVHEFDRLRPEHILEELYKQDSKKFVVDPNVRESFVSNLYLSPLMQLLAPSIQFMMCDAVEDSDGTFRLYPSIMSKVSKIISTKDQVLVHFDDISKLQAITLDDLINSDVVSVRFGPNVEILKGVPVLANGLVIKDHQNEIKIGNSTFHIDALLLSNFNNDVCGVGHSIAGVTCNDTRYMYNGWVRRTTDPAMLNQRALQMLPCELMEYDWLHEKGNFCISRRCGLRRAHQTDATKHICFNVRAGKRTYLCVRKP